MRSTQTTDAVQIDSWLTEEDERSLANDVLDGLTRPFKELAPKHFYDTRGSELFERSPACPSTTRPGPSSPSCARDAGEIVAATAAGELVELGSGTSEKARVLLDAMGDAGTLHRYVPLDVSAVVVAGSGDACSTGTIRASASTG